MKNVNPLPMFKFQNLSNDIVNVQFGHSVSFIQFFFKDSKFLWNYNIQSVPHLRMLETHFLAFPYNWHFVKICLNLKKLSNSCSFSYLSLGHKLKTKIAMLKNAWESFKSCTMHFIKKYVSILFLFYVLPYQFEILRKKYKLCFSHHVKPSKQSYNMKSHYHFHFMWVHYFAITLLIKVYVKGKILLWVF